MSCHDTLDKGENIIIDLTDSFTSVERRTLRNVIINLDTDDSIIDLSTSLEKSTKSISKFKLKDKTSTPNKDDAHPSRKSSYHRKQHRFGDCPICWDELGKNRLASTKCGHVFCLKCLKRSLKIEKKCPTCRMVLKTNSAYHPLYLNID